MVRFQCDRLAADMAVELKSRGVYSVSLWPGAVQTELVSQFILEKDTPQGIESKVDPFLTANPLSMVATSDFFLNRWIFSSSV